MGRRLFFWEAAGFFFVAAAGTLLHFLYNWSGESAFVAAFSAINESVWEHMKLLLVPMFLFSVVQIWALWKTYPNFLAVRAVSTLTGLILIPVLYYTYTGVLGYRVSWVNVVIFYLADLGAFLLDHRLLRRGRFNSPWQQLLGVVVLWALAFCFVWCTFRTPQLGLWRDPATGQIGI